MPEKRISDLKSNDFLLVTDVFVNKGTLVKTAKAYTTPAARTLATMEADAQSLTATTSSVIVPVVSLILSLLTNLENLKLGLK